MEEESPGQTSSPRGAFRFQRISFAVADIRHGPRSSTSWARGVEKKGCLEHVGTRAIFFSTPFHPVHPRSPRGQLGSNAALRRGNRGGRKEESVRHSYPGKEISGTNNQPPCARSPPIFKSRARDRTFVFVTRRRSFGCSDNRIALPTEKSSPPAVFLGAMDKYFTPPWPGVGVSCRGARSLVISRSLSILFTPRR